MSAGCRRWRIEAEGLGFVDSFVFVICTSGMWFLFALDFNSYLDMLRDANPCESAKLRDPASP